jgi:hypothetical protein
MRARIRVFDVVFMRARLPHPIAQRQTNRLPIS